MPSDRAVLFGGDVGVVVVQNTVGPPSQAVQDVTGHVQCVWHAGCDQGVRQSSLKRLICDAMHVKRVDRVWTCHRMRGEQV